MEHRNIVGRERFENLLAQTPSDRLIVSDLLVSQTTDQELEERFQELTNPKGHNPNWQIETEFEVDSHIVSLHFLRNDLLYNIPSFDLELAVKRGFKLPQTKEYLVEALTNSGRVTFDFRGYIGTPYGKPTYEERLGSTRQHDNEECIQLAKTLLYGLELGLFDINLQSLDNYYPFRSLEFDPEKELRSSERYSFGNDYYVIKPSPRALV